MGQQIGTLGAIGGRSGLLDELRRNGLLRFENGNKIAEKDGEFWGYDSNGKLQLYINGTRLGDVETARELVEWVVQGGESTDKPPGKLAIYSE